MQFINLAAQQRRIRSKIEANIKTVLDHGKYIMGPEVAESERQLSAYVGVKHAITCSSGTDALLMGLMAYNIGPGDAVLTTPFTFIATAEVISLLGATPIFVDIDPVTFNIDPVKLDITIRKLKSETRNLKGIIAVDLFGLPADYDPISSIARENHLFVIEDAAQSFGAEYHGRKACSLGDIACTSFFPAKPLGCYGDGGAVFTDDDDLAEKMLSIRVHGKGSHKYDNARVGINGRFDTIQAAILLAKLDIFPEEVELRQKIAQVYTECIRASKLELIPPSVPDGIKSVWAQYSILSKDEEHRTIIQDRLGGVRIPTAIYYPIPLHLQPAFDYLGYKEGDFPISEAYSRRIFSFPMHPYLSKVEQERIIWELEK